MDFFGSLVTRTRLAQGRSLAELAARAGLDPDALRVIESGTKSVTMRDAVVLAQACGLSIATTSRALHGWSLAPADDPVVTLDDVRAMEALTARNPAAAVGLLADLLGSLVAQRVLCSLSLSAAELIPHILVPAAPLRPVRVVLSYPPLAGRLLRRLALAGGAILDADIRAYAEACGLTEREPSRGAARTLANLSEGTLLSSLKLRSVLELDAALGQRGIFLWLSWYRLAPAVPAAAALLLLSRWHDLAADGLSADWLAGLRAAFVADLVATPSA